MNFHFTEEQQMMRKMVRDFAQKEIAPFVPSMEQGVFPKEILQKMNQGQGTIGKLINDPDLYRNARMTLQKVDKATEGLEDQGPLSVMGIIINNLF